MYIRYLAPDDLHYEAITLTFLRGARGYGP